MVCWGRLRTIPAAFRCTRTVCVCDPDARAFGHVIGQALQSPKRERHPQATRTATNRVDHALQVLFGHPARRSRLRFHRAVPQPPRPGSA